MQLERSFAVDVALHELRALPTDPTTLVGYAARFNVKSQPFPGFTEIIRPGAFKKTLAAGVDVRALVEHDPGKMLARSGGGLELREDELGLRVKIKPLDTQLGRDTLLEVDAGVRSQMSFGFRLPDKKSGRTGDRFTQENDEALRELLDVDLLDVSIVAFPAYDRTSIEARSLLLTEPRARGKDQEQQEDRAAAAIRRRNQILEGLR